MLGRLLVGLSNGLSTCLVGMYLSEIAPVNKRGAIGTVNQLGVTCGLFTSMILGLRYKFFLWAKDLILEKVGRHWGVFDQKALQRYDTN